MIIMNTRSILILSVKKHGAAILLKLEVADRAEAVVAGCCTSSSGTAARHQRWGASVSGATMVAIRPIAQCGKFCDRSKFKSQNCLDFLLRYFPGTNFNRTPLQGHNPLKTNILL
jgi:hypothetical protein